MTATKTEEPWTKDTEGMVTTVVVLVKDDDTVDIEDHFFKEFGFEPERGTPTVDSHQERLVTAFPVEYVRERLEAEGWTRVDQAA